MYTTPTSIYIRNWPENDKIGALPNGANIMHSATIERTWIDCNCAIRSGATVSDSTLAYGSCVYENARLWQCSLAPYSSARDHVVAHHATLHHYAVLYENAVACNAEIPGHASVRANADIRHPSHIHVLSGIGSESRYVTVYRAATAPGSDLPWEARIAAGCWCGTVSELRERIENQHEAWPDYEVEDGIDIWQKQYRIVCELAEAAQETWNEAATDERIFRQAPTIHQRHPNWDQRYRFSYYRDGAPSNAEAAAHEIVRFPLTPASADV